jgi:anti-sigma B factor antagonist
MQLRERRVGGVTILDLGGRLTINDDLGRFKEKFATLIYRGEKNIVFNLGELNYVDSSGLGELVACHNAAWRGGSTIKLANAGKRVQDLLVLTKLVTIFEAYESEAAALDSFAVPA